MAYHVSAEEFDAMIDDALDLIPDSFARRMRNVVILVEDHHPEQPYLLGLYEGVALPDRTFDHSGHLPDAITIYKESIERIVHSKEELADEVRVTVLHELGHYFGLDEATLHRLGWG